MKVEWNEKTERLATVDGQWVYSVDPAVGGGWRIPLGKRRYIYCATPQEVRESLAALHERRMNKRQARLARLWKWMEHN